LQDNPETAFFTQSNQSPASEHSLLDGFKRSVRNNAVGEAAMQLCRVGGIVYLARHLLPSDFGLYRMLLVISAILVLLIEAGIPEALIQRKILSSEHEATGWWISAVTGLVGSAMLYLLAPLLSRLLLMPRLDEQLRLLCLPILFAAASTVSGARLRRTFRFGWIAFADTLAELAFLVGAILILVRYESPRWSLCGGLAMRYTVRAVVLLIASAYLPREGPRRQTARELAGFAMPVLSGRLLAAFSYNADYVIIGRVLGSTTLGYYTIAWDLLRFVPDRLAKIVGRVALPLFSQMQDDDAALRQRYCALVRDTARVLLPLMIGVAIAAPEVVTVLYGAQWYPAAAPLRILAVGITLMGISIGIGPIFYAKGRPIIDLYLHTARLALIVAVLSGVARFGLLPASIAMSAVEGLMTVIGQGIANWLIGLRASRMISSLTLAIRNAAVAAALTEAGRVIASAANLHDGLALALIVALPAIALGFIEAPMLFAMIKAMSPGRAATEAGEGSN
jgi:O-antigen/teichoic acid export membrane protein